MSIWISFQQQVERAAAQGKTQETEYTELKRGSDEEKIKLSLGETFKKPDRPSTSTYLSLLLILGFE